MKMIKLRKRRFMKTIQTTILSESHTKLKRFLRPLNGPYSVLIFWRHKLPTLLIKSL